jgi:hypothetical protein
MAASVVKMMPDLKISGRELTTSLVNKEEVKQKKVRRVEIS